MPDILRDLERFLFGHLHTIRQRRSQDFRLGGGGVRCSKVSPPSKIVILGIANHFSEGPNFQKENTSSVLEDPCHAGKGPSQLENAPLRIKGPIPGLTSFASLRRSNLCLKSNLVHSSPKRAYPKPKRIDVRCEEISGQPPPLA